MSKTGFDLQWIEKPGYDSVVRANSTMQNKFMLSPYSLDEHVAELEGLIQTEWKLNEAVLPTGGMPSRPTDNVEKQARMNVIHQSIAEFVAETLAQGDRPVSIAGDCCTTLGVLAGLQRAGIEPVLIWLDAHGDFNTRETTPSGFLGGMPLAMAAGRGEQTMLEALGLKPIPEQRVILCDGRDLDPGEMQALAGSAVTHITDIHSLPDRIGAGLGYSSTMSGERPDPPLLYIHFDTDIVNPEDAPSMSYRAVGGPRAAELSEVFQLLARTGRVAAVSMCTWKPGAGEEVGRTRQVCMNLLSDLL